jgi:hypothetical protein
VEERGNKPRPRFDLDVDAEREFDEDAWRSIVFVIEESFLWWRLNGRRALTLTILLVDLLELELEEKKTLDAPFLGSYYPLHSFLQLLSVYNVCIW